MATYGREVSEREVRDAETRAAWDAFNREPAPVREALFSVPRGSQAFSRALNVLNAARADLERPQQVRQVGTDGTPQMLSTGRRPVGTQQLVDRAGYAMSPTMLTGLRALGVDTSPFDARMASRSTRTNQPAPAPAADQPVYNIGYVNGRADMAPTPGNYGNVLKMRADVGAPMSTTDLDFAGYDAAQEGLAGQGYANADMNFVQQALAANRQAEKAAALKAAERREKQEDATLAHNRQLELERVKTEPELAKAGKPKTEDARKFHADRLKQREVDQAEYKRLKALTTGKTPDMEVQVGENEFRTVGEVRAMMETLNYPAPSYQDSLAAFDTPDAQAELESMNPTKPRPADQQNVVPSDRQAEYKAWLQGIASSDPDPARRQQAKQELAKL